jgi:hypothetical protein
LGLNLSWLPCLTLILTQEFVMVDAITNSVKVL